jgi:hypothetical protein
MKKPLQKSEQNINSGAFDHVYIIIKVRETKARN